MEMARSYLKEMNLPSMLWAEAVRHTVYVLNRLPTRALTGVTPYEVWYEKKPDIGHIRIFGCTVHMKLQSKNVQKLDDRSKSVVNLGREPGTKGYRLYDPKERHVHISKDVVFEEDKPWPWNDLEAGDTHQDGSFCFIPSVTQEDGSNHYKEAD